MALDNVSLSIVADQLKEQLVGATFGNPLALGENHFGIPYSEVLPDTIRHGTLVFSLEPNNPFVSYSMDRYTKVAMNTPFFNSLKKMAMGTVTSVSKRKGERILTITVSANPNDLTEINSGYDFILELFPNRPNCYLIAYPYGKIVSLYKEKTDLEKGIFVARNVPYVYPPERDTLPTEVKDIAEVRTYLTNFLYRNLERYVSQGHDLNETLKKIAASKQIYLLGKDIVPFSFDQKEAKPLAVSEIYQTYIGDQKELARREKEKDLMKLIEKALKVAKKKLNNLNEDLSSAKERMVYYDYGQLIYQYQAEIHKGDTSLEMDGYKIPLNPIFDAPNNANRYFKLYRKAKSGIEILNGLIEKNKDEIDYLIKKETEVQDGTPRDILELKSELIQEGYIKEKQSKRYVPKASKNKKCEPHYLLAEGGKIGFGMNGLQNETLTFDIATKEDVFLHIKDYPGAHVVILEGKEKQRVIDLAAELACYLSHQESGTVMIAKRKDVKKNPNHIGLVNILRYSTLEVKGVRDASLELFRKELKR